MKEKWEKFVTFVYNKNKLQLVNTPVLSHQSFDFYFLLFYLSIF